MSDHSAPSFRSARKQDLPLMIAMLRHDWLGAGRESAFDDAAGDYEAAFEVIDADLNNEIIVAEIMGEMCGCLQLTFIPGLTYQGGERAQIEGVRVDENRRGAGVGRLMLDYAIARARARGCVLVQLTSDKTRDKAIGFYRDAGFTASHEGMKLRLR